MFFTRKRLGIMGFFVVKTTLNQRSLETHSNENICPICGETTAEDLPVEVYWHSHCKTPILQVIN